MRLIDADALKVDYLVPSSTSSTPNFYYVSKASIDKAPTIDAVPMRHGEWIVHTEVKNIYGGICIECSVCGDHFVVLNVSDEKYCRSCGAKMYGGKDDQARS